MGVDKVNGALTLATHADGDDPARHIRDVTVTSRAPTVTRAVYDVPRRVGYVIGFHLPRGDADTYTIMMRLTETDIVGKRITVPVRRRFRRYTTPILKKKNITLVLK